MKKIISYSLWLQDKQLCKNKINENKNMYYHGLVRNLEILNKKEIYKDWIIRCYINDTVPKKLQNKLEDLGCELVNMSKSRIPGMFWRFLVFQDKDCSIFLVRDTDSRINVREEEPVNEWIKSNKLMHIMRDHPHHYYKILGGMWGYRNDLQRLDITKFMDDFLKKRNYQFKRMDDMLFLDLIYDILNTKTLEHDQFFNYKYSQKFPDNSYQNDYYKYVGEIYDENDIPINKKRDTELFKNKNYKKMIKGINYR